MISDAKATGKNEIAPVFSTGNHAGQGPDGPQIANLEAVSKPSRPEPPVFMLTAYGSRDSHAVTLANGEPNKSRRAGKPYAGITWQQIRQMVDDPASTPKERAQFFFPSSYVECDGRTHAVQRERGTFHGLAVDIDDGNPTLDQVVAGVQAVAGAVAAEIYSSSSATPDCRKWRALIPLATPVAGSDYHHVQRALFGLLREQGLVCCPSLARPGQPIYLPNVPPKRRGPDGKPLFYQSARLDGPELALVPGHAIMVARDRLAATADQEREEATARAADSKARRAAYVEATGDNFIPSDDYNAHHTIRELLVEYGFKEDPKDPNNWSSPLSESGTYALLDYGTHWTCLSAWPEKHDVGFRTKSGFRSGSAFDLFVAFAHGGNRKAAARAWERIARPQLAPVRVEEPEAIDDEPLSLDDWRAEFAANVAIEADRPGIKHANGQPGSGKTFAILQDLSKKKRAVVACPSHDLCHQVVEQLQAFGVTSVAAYPKLTTDNCANYSEAARAQAAGLVVGATVCRGCPFYDSCREEGYLAGVRAAERAKFQVVTHDRLARSAGKLLEKAEALLVDEDCSNLLRPSVVAGAADLDDVADLAEAVGLQERAVERERASLTEQVEAFHDFADHAAAPGAAIEHDRPEATTKTGAFFDQVAKLAQHLAGEIRRARRELPPGVHAVALPAAVEAPRNPDAAIWRAMTAGHQAVDPQALRMAMLATTGRLSELWLQVEAPDKRVAKAGAPALPSASMVGYLRSELASHAKRIAIYLADGTSTTEQIELLTGQPVEDITPPGAMVLQQHATQYALDVIPSTSPRKVAAIVAGIVRAHPDRPWVGLVLLKCHHDALLAEGADLLPPDVRHRIRWATYYGSGRDRGSNELHRLVDLCVVVGTLRPPPAEIRRKLLQLGQVEAASLQATWGAVERQGQHDQGTTIYRGRGYAEQAWASAADALTRAATRQAVGRARAITPEGVAVVCVTTEATGLPVRPGDDVPMLDRRIEAVVGALRRGVTGPKQPPEVCLPRLPSIPTMVPTDDKNPKDILGRMSSVVGGPSLTFGELVAALPEVNDRTAQRWVAAAVEAGVVIREGSTTATRYRLAMTDHQATALHAAHVSTAFPDSFLRRKELSWTHHKEVANHPQAEAAPPAADLPLVQATLPETPPPTPPRPPAGKVQPRVGGRGGQSGPVPEAPRRQITLRPARPAPPPPAKRKHVSVLITSTTTTVLPVPAPQAPRRAAPPQEPRWLAAALRPAKHPKLLRDVRELHAMLHPEAGDDRAWRDECTPPLVRRLSMAAATEADRRGEPPPGIEVVARHTTAWHALRLAGTG
jgi:hypothetical protein